MKIKQKGKVLVSRQTEGAESAFTQFVLYHTLQLLGVAEIVIPGYYA